MARQLLSHAHRQALPPAPPLLLQELLVPAAVTKVARQLLRDADGQALQPARPLLLQERLAPAAVAKVARQLLSAEVSGAAALEPVEARSAEAAGTAAVTAAATADATADATAALTAALTADAAAPAADMTAAAATAAAASAAGASSRRQLTVMSAQAMAATHPRTQPAASPGAQQPAPTAADDTLAKIRAWLARASAATAAAGRGAVVSGLPVTPNVAMVVQRQPSLRAQPQVVMALAAQLAQLREKQERKRQEEQQRQKERQERRNALAMQVGVLGSGFVWGFRMFHILQRGCLYISTSLWHSRRSWRS